MPFGLQGVSCDLPVEGLTLVPGAGVYGVVGGRAVAAGTAALLAEQQGVPAAELEAAAAGIQEQGARWCCACFAAELTGGWLTGVCHRSFHVFN